MECPKGADQVADMSSSSGRTGSAGARQGRFQRESLRCVWTGAPESGVSCLSQIPEAVVAEAWRRELERGGVRSDRCFRIAWRNGVWLAYGLKDGDVVGGVRCPSHSADRDAPALVAYPRAEELALCA
jgi:hypothetical protein